MVLLSRIAAWSGSALVAILFLGQLVAYQAGYRLGRTQTRRDEAPGEGVGVLLGGLLALLSFVLALTLSFANDQFYERRKGTLAEANSISTAWLRAKAVRRPQGEAIMEMLEEYTRLRREFVAAPDQSPSLKAIATRTNALQSAMWTDVSELMRAEPSPASTALMAALNAVFDSTTNERFAYDLRLSTRILWLLLALTLLGAGGLGYQLGLRGPNAPLLAGLLFLAWSLVIVDTLDLGSGRLGGIRTSVAPYDWSLEGFQPMGRQNVSPTVGGPGR